MVECLLMYVSKLNSNFKIINILVEYIFYFSLIKLSKGKTTRK